MGFHVIESIQGNLLVSTKVELVNEDGQGVKEQKEQSNLE